MDREVKNMMDVVNIMNEWNVSEDRTIWRERLKAGGSAK